jgi:hypothetical protein
LYIGAPITTTSAARKSASAASPAAWSSRRLGAHPHGQVLAAEVAQRAGGQVAIGHRQARVGGLEPRRDGGGHLAADGVVAEHAGVDVEQVHERSPFGEDVVTNCDLR